MCNKILQNIKNILTCTHKPVFGMDSLDSSLAQDIESYILFREYGIQPERLSIYESKDEVDIVEYIKNRGFGENANTIFDYKKSN